MKFSLLLFSSFWVLTFSYNFNVVIAPVKQVWKISKQEYGKSHIIYRIGENTVLEQRTMTASHVALLKDAVRKSFPQNVISITRETYNNQATTFNSLLELSPVHIPRLYRIMYTYKRKIVQVPINPNEISSRNSFLFYGKSVITIFHGQNVNNKLKERAELYAKYILTSEENMKYILIIDDEKKIHKLLIPQFEENDLQHVAGLVKTKENTDFKDITEVTFKRRVELDMREGKKLKGSFKDFYRNFMRKLKNLSRYYIDTEENSDEDKSGNEQSSDEDKYEEIQQFLEEKLVIQKEEEMVKIRLYEFPHESKRQPTFINKRPIYLKYNSNIDVENEYYLKSDRTYLLKEMCTGHTYIYIGKYATTEQIQDVMEFAETLAFTNVSNDNAWKLITVVQEDTPAPFHFRINFRDEENYISSFFKN